MASSLHPIPVVVIAPAMEYARLSCEIHQSNIHIMKNQFILIYVVAGCHFSEVMKYVINITGWNLSKSKWRPLATFLVIFDQYNRLEP